jgi:hypothetical protein
MSRAVDSLYTLYNNPFILAGVLVEFYKHYSGHQKNDVLLSYLVLPVTLYEHSKIGLQQANKQRSIRSFVKSKDRMFGLTERIKEYKDMTNKTLQFAIDQRYLQIDDVLSVIVLVENEPPPNPGSKTHLVASANLAKMVDGVDVVSVFRQFGIKEL